MIDLRTYHNPKPIPRRDFDWEAVDHNNHDLDSPVGYGATEGAAICDLFEKLAEEEAA